MRHGRGLRARPAGNGDLRGAATAHGRLGVALASGDDDNERPDADEIFGFDRRRALLTLGLAAVLGIGALAILSQATNLDKAFTAVRRAHKLWFVGLLAGQLLGYAGYGLGYRTIARSCGGPCLRYGTALQLTVVSFGGYVLASSAGGLAIDFWALRQAGEPLHKAARRVLAFNILEWAVLGAFATAAGIATLLGAGRHVPLSMAIAWLVVPPAAAGGALWITRRGRKTPLARLPDEEVEDEPGWVTHERLSWLWLKVRRGFADAIGALVYLRALLGRPRRYGEGPLGFAVYWLGDLLTLYAAVRALGGSVGPVDLVLAYATGYVITSAPLPAGAAGFSEATTSFALSAVGVPLGIAIFAVFLYRIFTFWLPIAPAVAMIPRVRGLADTLADLPREEDPPCAVAVDHV